MSERPIDDPYWHDRYKTPANLNARLQLHRRFSTNPQGWFNWLGDLIDLQPGDSLLEIGCGPGDLWLENAHHLRGGSGAVCLSDYSVGMVATSRQRLGEDPRFRYLSADAQHMPLASSSFNRVIANHMLYHVPDIDRAVGEMARLLVPGGRVYAATGGENSMPQMESLIREFNPDYRMSNPARRFNLENGGAFFEPYFKQVRVARYEDSLWVTEAPALAEYILSMGSGQSILAGHNRAELEALIDRHIRERGGFFINKAAGVILASDKVER